MIQRKQSVWLLLAALFSAGVLYFNIYAYHNMASGVDTLDSLKVADHYPSLLLAVITILVPLVAIFMFKNRKLQMRLAFISLLSTLSFLSIALWRVQALNKMVPPPVSGSYGIGAILPVFSIILLFMAIAGIRKDDKLVKSVDRLR